MQYSVRFSDFDKEIDFLTNSFAHLGFKEFVRPIPGVAGLGDDTGAWFWLSGIQDGKPIPDDTTVLRVHVALKAKGMYGIAALNNGADSFGLKDAKGVDEFYSAALKAGGKDNGAPGTRAMYHPGYYAAFVISPGGHNIECVIHDHKET
jgi:hypothetical protein